MEWIGRFAVSTLAVSDAAGLDEGHVRRVRRGARELRDRFHGDRTDEDHAYLHTRKVLGDRPPAETADLSNEIVWFLNQWACRLPTEAASKVLSSWIREHARSLAEQSDSDILDPRISRRLATYQRLYDSLLKFKSKGVPNMSDAATAKVLHQLQPRLFVMWDNNIKPYAESYSAFMEQMHRFSLRLRASAPSSAQPDIEGFLQNELGYPVRKTLAKYLDEYNWYLAFGRDRATR